MDQTNFQKDLQDFLEGGGQDESENKTDASIFDEMETIRHGDTPTSQKWKLVPLYGTSKSGYQLYWQIGFDGKRLVIDDGRTEPRYREVETNQSKRNLQQQALQEAIRRFEDKYYAGYSHSEDFLEDIINPMTAKDFSDGKRGIQFPVAVQPKLNGIRALVLKKGNEIIFKSRTNKNHSKVNLSHIEPELAKFLSYLPEKSILDGELYVHGLKLDQIRSIIFTRKSLHSGRKQLKFYIFDVIEHQNLVYEDRHNLLIDAFKKFLEDGHVNNYFHIVVSNLVHSVEEIHTYHDEFVKMGYEGLVIRKIAGENPTKQSIEKAQYQSKRTFNILKLKNFKDEEGIIIDVEEGMGSHKGIVANLILLDPSGKQIKVPPTGNFGVRRKWLENPKQVIGKKYTYRYMEKSPDGYPIHPIGVTFRDYD